MPFWNDVSAEPKLSFRWYSTFGYGYHNIRTYCLRSFQKPSFEIAVNEYIWLNDVEYRPGLVTWNPIEIVITDAENKDDNNTLKLWNMLKLAGYQNGNINAPRSALEKSSSTAALGGDIRFTQINARGNPLEEWSLVNPFISQVNFGQANYVADEIMSISLTLRYDYAMFKTF